MACPKLPRCVENNIAVRLDLFLKRSRIIKQREAAKQACDRGMVTIAGRPVKPGYRVSEEEVIVVEWPQRRLEFEVAHIPSGQVSREGARNMYRILRDVPIGGDPFDFFPSSR